MPFSSVGPPMSYCTLEALLYALFFEQINQPFNGEVAFDRKKRSHQTINGIERLPSVESMFIPKLSNVVCVHPVPSESSYAERVSDLGDTRPITVPQNKGKSIELLMPSDNLGK